MILADSNLEARVLRNTRLHLQGVCHPFLNMAGHLRHRYLLHNRQDSTDNKPCAIPPDVICVAKTPGQCRDDRIRDIGFHRDEDPLLIRTIDEKDVVEMAGAFGALGFAFQEVLKGLFVVCFFHRGTRQIN
jgi:hypothetical protein